MFSCSMRRVPNFIKKNSQFAQKLRRKTHEHCTILMDSKRKCMWNTAPFFNSIFFLYSHNPKRDTAFLFNLIHFVAECFLLLLSRIFRSIGQWRSISRGMLLYIIHLTTLGRYHALFLPPAAVKDSVGVIRQRSECCMWRCQHNFSYF